MRPPSPQRLRHSLAAIVGGAVLLHAGCGAMQDEGRVLVFEAESGQPVREALQQALDEAVAAGPGVTLKIKPGVYRLEIPRGAKEFALKVAGARGLTIAAGGAEFVVANPTVGFLQIEDSDGVVLRGMSVDYDPLPFAAGRVVGFADDRRSFVVEPLRGYPLPDHWQFTEARGWGCFLDPEVPGRLAAGMPNVVFEQSVEALPDGRFRYHFERPVPTRQAPQTEGLLFVRIVKVGQLFFSTNSRRIRYEHITSHASSSGHYVGNNCEDISVIDCHALIRDGRVKGGNADGVHLQNTRGPIVVKDSSFIGISDDAVNLYQKPHVILEKKAPTRWLVSSVPGRPGSAAKPRQRPGSGTFRAGDRVTAYNDHTARTYGPVDVVSFDPETGMMEVSAPLDIPDDPGELARIGLYGDGFANNVTIRGCTFADSRRFGVYLKTRDAVVADNVFRGLSASAIVGMNDTNHGEGAGTHGLLIENNRIEDCGFSLNFMSNQHWQAISFFAQVHPFEIRPVPGFHSDITIRDNSVIHSPRGFFLQSIRGLTLEGNTFQPDAGRPAGEVPVELTGSEVIPR